MFLRTPVAGQGGLVLVSEGLPSSEQWRQDFTFADMDGDGRRDLITAPPRKGTGTRPYIFLSRQGRWEEACRDVPNGGFPQKEYNYGGVAVADFDGDGLVEIAIAMHETGLRLFRSRQAGPCGPWEERQELPQEMTTMRTRAVAAADMDLDGRIDLVTISEVPGMNLPEKTPGVVLFRNTPSGWQPQPLPGTEQMSGDDIAVGEVNGDGIPDIAVGSLDAARSEFVWLSDGKGGWQATKEGLPEVALGWTVQLRDMDGDDRDELVLGLGAPLYLQNAGPRVYQWDGARWQNRSQGLPQVSWVCGVVAADLNGDGQPELVAADMNDGGMHVYARQADGTWSEQQQFQVIPPEQKLRNYKVRALVAVADARPLIVANYASEQGGKILAWQWQEK